MCRNIRTLFNFEPPATEAEIHGSPAAADFIGNGEPGKESRD